MEIKIRKETQSDYSDVFMAIELVENGLHGISGVVEYPKEFEEAG